MFFPKGLVGIVVTNNLVNFIEPYYGLFGTIDRLIAKQIGKWFSKKIMPDKGLNLFGEDNADKDGVSNFLDPDYPPNQPCIQTQAAFRSSMQAPEIGTLSEEV